MVNHNHSRRFERNWRKRPSIITPRYISGNVNMISHQMWENMLLRESSMKTKNDMQKTQILIEESLVKDIVEAADYKLEIENVKYQCNFLDPRGKLGLIPARKEQIVEIQEENENENSYETFNDESRNSSIKETAKSSFDVLLDLCEQNQILSWSDLPPSILYEPYKLGEGAFGEVYEADWNGEKVALKIMAFQDASIAPYCELVNGDYLKTPEDLINELRLTKELSNLNETSVDSEGRQQMTPNFVRLVKSVIVQGMYPKQLLKAWETYKQKNKNKEKKKSYNDCPSTYSSSDRLYIIFALSIGGEDLDNFKVKGKNEAMSIFLQVAISLHVAERMLQFEHRDLHVSNILVTRDEECQELIYVIDGNKSFLKTHGIKVDIIDYTYSRIYVDGDFYYFDLKDDLELFMQPGVKDGGKYQADIYRKMKNNNGNDWQPFLPRTNVFWLHYLAYCLFLQRPRSITSGIKSDLKLQLDQIFDENKFDNFQSTSSLLNDPAIKLLMQEYVVQNEENISLNC